MPFLFPSWWRYCTYHGLSTYWSHWYLEQTFKEIHPNPTQGTFPHSLIIAIKRELNAWCLRHTPHPITVYPEPICSMIKDNHQLGWNQFLLGFLPLSWKRHLFTFLQNKQLLRRYSPELWTSKIIRALWLFLHDTWEDRCRKLHDTDLIHDFSWRQALIVSIKAELAIGLHNRLFSFPHPILFN